MRILFWVPYPTEGASNRFRVEQYLPYLGREGIKYDLHAFWSSSAFSILYKKGRYLNKIYFFIMGVVSRFLDLARIPKYDVVFIHREAYPLGSSFFETLLGLLKKPVIFDFDDAIFLPYSSRQNIFIERFKKPEKVCGIIKMSSRVIAGNSYLADYALRYNKNVSVIPTPIDSDKYYPEMKTTNNKIIIGWIGSVTTSDFLNEMERVFAALSKKFDNIEFRIVGGNFQAGGQSNITSKPWALDQEIADLRSFDIGIMPMPDNEWTRGKCGFKAILYMSMGIPAVCSPVGMNKEIVADGVNGFLAIDENQWVEKLGILIKDAALRRKMGLAARKTAEEKYSVKVNAPKFLNVIKEAYSQNKQERR